MPAMIRLGLGGGLPGEPSVQETLDHLTAFADLGFCWNFYEFVGGSLYSFIHEDGKTTVHKADPRKPLPGWTPHQWMGDYTYETWYAATSAAWERRPGGDVTYDEWEKLDSVSIFVPFYEGRKRWVKFGRHTDAVGVVGVEYGNSMAHELDLHRSFFDALQVAGEFQYLARISG